MYYSILSVYLSRYNLRHFYDKIEPMDDFTIKNLSKVSLSMFRKNFFGVFHGSISAKIEYNRFVINKRDAIFDELDENSLIKLYHKKDYRWNDASIDAPIHSSIYQAISDAKYIAYGMPPYTTAYSLRFDKIVPQDYFGKHLIGKIDIFNPKDLDTWYERADVEISRHLKETPHHMMVIRGYGVYVYDRDLYQMAKKLAIIENSARLLYLSYALDKRFENMERDIYHI